MMYVRIINIGFKSTKVLVMFLILTISLFSCKLENKLTLIKKGKSNYEIVTKTTASKEILSLNEASEYLSLSKSDLYKKTSRRIIPHFKPGKHIFFKKKDLDSFILANPQK